MVSHIPVNYVIQYVNESLISHLLPLYHKIGGIEGHAETIEDGAPYL